MLGRAERPIVTAHQCVWVGLVRGRRGREAAVSTGGAQRPSKVDEWMRRLVDLSRRRRDALVEHGLSKKGIDHSALAGVELADKNEKEEFVELGRRDVGAGQDGRNLHPALQTDGSGKDRMRGDVFELPALRNIGAHCPLGCCSAAASRRGVAFRERSSSRPRAQDDDRRGTK